MARTSSVVSFDGVQITYNVSGENVHDDVVTIVFVHGWTCNRTHWKNQVSAFSDRWRSVAIDLAGHGDSSLGRIDYSVPNFAQDVVAVLDHEQVSRVVLIGHSMGGMVIIHAAEMLGEWLVGLVGADTFKFLRQDPASGKQAEQLEILNSDYHSTVSEIVSSLFTNDTPDVIRKNISAGMLAAPKEVGMGGMRAMVKDVALFDAVSGFQFPKFAFNATGRPMDEKAASDAGIDVRYLPTNGHFVMNEDPDGFNRLLDEALRGMFE